MRFGLLFLLIFFAVQPARAQAIIRDTEIETTLGRWTTPILNAAGFEQGQVRLVLVDSSDINAFVAGGANIFIYSGLIQKATSPDEVVGVIAHELGHISGGHLIAGRKAIERASFQSILATALGIGAALVTGDGRAAGVITMGGTGMAGRGFLSHSRTQESSADQAALKYLDGAEMSPAGMVSFLEKLQGEELLPASQQSEYARTHPLTRDRIDAMKTGLKNASFADNTAPAAEINEFNRMKAKLIAFRTPQQVTRFYPDPNESVAARYAYAIMHYRQNNFDQSIQLMDQLIQDHPQDAFFYELRGQIARDAGRMPQAEADYSKALDLLNQPAPLIQVDLAHVLIEQNKDLETAEQLLLTSLSSEQKSTQPYRLLATIKGRQNDEAAARYYLAEEAAGLGRTEEAKKLLDLATHDNSLDATLTLKAADLKRYLEGLSQYDN